MRGESDKILVSMRKAEEEEKGFDVSSSLSSFLAARGILSEKRYVEKDDELGEGGRYQVNHNIVFWREFFSAGKRENRRFISW